ncbi:MAG: FctA domain-containing protein [Oliverpabstia sp.]|nr:FctA domain-containing protein [Oliverpabstia sp.]
MKVSFLGGQLAGELGASDAENVVIKHLPVKDEVKENAAKDGQRTTADMTDLSADDIQVEDVKKAKVTLDTEAKIATVDEEDEEEEEVTESKDEVTFGVESFCVFAFSAGAGGLNNAASWEGSQTISVKSFKDKLGLAGHTAIYASVLDNTSDHLEGSIVVDTFNDSGNNVLNFAQRLVTQNEIQSITITKKVYDVSSAPREFKMGFYSDSNGKNKEADVTVTVPANKLSGSICIRRAANPSLFNVLANHSLYVYEIDDKGNPSKDAFYDADENKKYSVAYENPENSSMPNEIESDKGEFGNYINVINRADQYGAREYFGEKGFHTYLGSDYADDKYVDSNNQIHSDAQNNKFLWIKHADGTDSIRLQDYKDLAGATDTYIHNLGAEEFERRTKLKKNLGIDEEDLECVFAKESIRLADAKRGTTKGKTNFNVINLISSSGKLVDDLKYANFHEPENGHAINSLLQTDEKDDEYLLINIDATNKDTYVLNQLSIDGENADSNDGYPRIGSHVIYNFVKKTSDGNFVPYTGTIEIDNVAAGMIFAPKATVRQVGGFRGSIVAYHVNRPGGAEIHQKCIGSSERRYVDITVSNTAPGPETTSVDLEATKILNGQTLQAGQFSFNLEGEDGSVLQTKQNTADGKIKFDRITYKEEDAGKTFNYTIKEVTKTDHNYKYDTHAANVTVKVEKDASGKLTATANYEDSKLIFTNTYINTAEGSIVLGAKKVLEGKDLIAGQFSFQLKDSSGKVLQTATNDKDGNIVFKEITYTLSDVGTKTYKIEEVNGKAAGYTYDDHVVDVKVNVTDNNDGTLVTSATYDGKAGYTFKNSYAAAGSVVLKVGKELSGRKLVADQFTFELVGTDGTVLQTKKNAADGSVTFDVIDYTQEDSGKSYSYQIREVNEGAPGYTYDDHIVDVKVSVTDNNDGTLATSATYDGEAGYTFTNTYTANGSAVLTAKKVLEGKNLAEGQFSFELKDKAGKVLETVTNAADGTISFAPINYSLADVGTKIYTIHEVEGGEKGYTYDKHVETVTVKISDKGDGTLDTAVDYDADGAVFTNYSIDFKVNKFERTGTRELDGAKIQIKDSTGAVIAEWISKSGETHDFGSSLKAGETYTIHEETAPSGYYTISDMNFTVGEKGEITLAGGSDDVKLEDGVIKICDERIKSSGGGGGGDHPHPTPETTPAETTPAETTVPETTPVETTAPETNPGGGNGGHHGPSEEVETDEFGNVLGANRGRNKKGQDGGNVKGASRGKTRTGDESMMSIFGFGFLAAVLVLLGWFGIRFTKRNRR